MHLGLCGIAATGNADDDTIAKGGVTDIVTNGETNEVSVGSTGRRPGSQCGIDDAITMLVVVTTTTTPTVRRGP